MSGTVGTNAGRGSGSIGVAASGPTVSSSDPAVDTNAALGTQWVNSTSGEFYVLTDDTTDANIWTNVGGGTDEVNKTGDIYTLDATVGTGGTITTDGKYKIHTFTSSGTFEITNLGSHNTGHFLVIAGGAGGQGDSGAGSGYGGGAGGAGGYRCSWNNERSGGGNPGGETAVTLSETTYTVTIGAGGASNSLSSDDGNDSVFGSITSDGGGGIPSGSDADGRAGGSGGGGTGGGTRVGGAGTANQGYAGGNNNTDSNAAGGGGGGAGEVGQNGSSATGGNGGNGVESSITGTLVYRAGGGGAGALTTAGKGGKGGGGNGQAGGGTFQTPGTANTGSGGGGVYNGNSTAGSGGSGIVIVAYQYLA